MVVNGGHGRELGRVEAVWYARLEHERKPSGIAAGHILWMIGATLWYMFVVCVVAGAKCGMLTGESGFIFTRWFFVVAGGTMSVCGTTAILLIVWQRRVSASLAIAAIVNLAPLYFVKLVLFGV